MTLELRRGVLASLMVLAVGTACDGDDTSHPTPQSSSATHFLEPCGTECPAGLECICGNCTRACSSSSVCEDISPGAVCTGILTSHPDCNSVAVGHACDVACTTDADCDGIPAAPHCALGFCRATANGAGVDSGSGGFSGTSGSGGASGSSGSSSHPEAGAGGTAGTDSGSGGTTSASGAGNPSAGSGGTSSGGTSSGGTAAGGDDGGIAGAGGTPAGAPVVSGTRLKAHYTTAGDGARVYRRGVFYDSMLGVDCQYGLGADGNLRCLPLPGAGAQYSDIYYSDDKCTAPYALLTTAPQGCAPALPKFTLAQGTASSACDSTPVVHVYPVEGTVITPPITYQYNGANCVMGGAGVPGTIKVRLKAELSPTSFVEGTKKAEP